jgi:hypothetical protein
MPPVITKVLRNRWFVVGVHAGLWFLLYVTLTHLGGKAPDFRETDAVANPPQSPAPVAGLDRLFLPGIWPKTLVQTNLFNPFYTTNFVQPPPPPPTTRKINVGYHGFSQIGQGIKQVGYKLDNAFNIAPIGTQIATELFIADATIQALMLTNVAAQTNIIGLNTNKDIIIPIK